jgi:hypothetical protein
MLEVVGGHKAVTLISQTERDVVFLRFESSSHHLHHHRYTLSVSLSFETERVYLNSRRPDRSELLLNAL